jgi:hypothetical protein
MRPAESYRGARRNAVLRARPRGVWRGAPAAWETSRQGQFQQPMVAVMRSEARQRLGRKT